MKITEGMSNIHIYAHQGRWHTVESKVYHGKTLWLLEEDTHGDEWPNLIVCENGDCLLDDGYDGWLNLDEAIDGGYILFQKDPALDQINIYKRVGWQD